MIQMNLLMFATNVLEHLAGMASLCVLAQEKLG